MEKKTLRKIEKIAAILLGIAVFAVCVYQLRYGIDVQDTSSYLTKFRYFFEKGTGGNALYYLLGEFFGSLVFHAFPTLYAMNVTGLIVWSLTGIMIYRIMKPYLTTLPLSMAVLGGIAFGASWVRCVNWNAWSVLFLSIGILFLLHGFDTGKKGWFAVAGFILGINTFVRFPNLVLLAVMTLPVAVYYFKFKNMKESLKDVWKYLGSLIAGGAAAGVVGCIFSIIFLGFDKFLADLLWLLGSSGDKESKHNLFDMFAKVITGAMDGARQWIKYGVIIGAVIVLCMILKKVLKKDVTLYGAVIAGALALILGFTRDVTTSSTPTLLSVQNFIAYGGILFGILGAFWFGIKTKHQDRRFAILCLMEAVTVFD